MSSTIIFCPCRLARLASFTLGATVLRAAIWDELH
jgi:hypothetical protein